MDMLDIYTDCSICQNKHATANEPSEMLEGEVVHDQVTRFLRLNEFSSKLVVTLTDTNSEISSSKKGHYQSSVEFELV